MTSPFGTSPTVHGQYSFLWDEYMHYMYLPVVLVGHKRLRLPSNLKFLRSCLERVIALEGVDTENPDTYVYLTARRGYAFPGNPLNRPGWHTDGFGSNDINYIWSDRYPTRFALQNFGVISEDHQKSMEEFQARVRPEAIRTYEPGCLLRLTPSVVHATPEIPAPGGDRSFIKVSFSKSRYPLRGNSHNHLFKYNWQMAARTQERNDPVGK